MGSVAAMPTNAAEFMCGGKVCQSGVCINNICQGMLYSNHIPNSSPEFSEIFIISDSKLFTNLGGIQGISCKDDTCATVSASCDSNGVCSTTTYSSSATSITSGSVAAASSTNTDFKCGGKPCQSGSCVNDICQGTSQR